MPAKRKAGVRNGSKVNRVKKVKSGAPATAPLPIVNKISKVPNELLVMIYKRCDMFSATVLSLTCKKLRILYKGLYEQHFGAEQRLWIGLGPTRSLGPVCLYLSYNYPDHTHRTMGSLLASWMPEGLIWDPQAGDIVRPEIFQATLESVCHGIQDLTDAKEKRHQERRGRNELERIALRDDRLSSYLAARSDRQLQRWVGEGSDEHDLDEDAMSDFPCLVERVGHG